jgi:hypothetical protein
MRARGVLAHWLVATHRLQLVLALAGAFALFGLPPVLDQALPRAYPPIRTVDSVLGAAALSTTPDPHVAEVRAQILLAAWALWLVATVVLMIAALPRAIGRGREGGPAGDTRRVGSDPGRGGAGAPAVAVRPEATVIEMRGNVAKTAAPLPALDDSAAPPHDAAAGAGPIGAASRYQILGELGRGGMGVVYHARDSVLQREVALKELPLQLGGGTDLAQRFRQEARVLAKLSHPNIVQVHDLIEDQGRLWIALEYVRGGTVADAMRYAGGALPWPEVVRIGRQIAEGLSFAHTQGVIHRDIKPMNVLVTADHPQMAKLTDFGLARLVESTEHTQPGSLLGSARYMSPEQVAGRPADARSDLYALGITFFEMLAGRVPFEGEFATVLARHASEPAPDVRSLVPDVPPELAALVGSLLAKAPADRPQSAEHVAYALRALAARDGETREAA